MQNSPSVPRRPPSPARSASSPTPSVRSAAASTSTSQARTRFDGASVNDVLEYIGRTHIPWDSAMREMARIEARQSEKDDEDRRSAASTVSCYSVAKSAISATSSARRGRLGMLPARAGDAASGRPSSMTFGTDNIGDLAGLITVRGGGAASASSARVAPGASPLDLSVGASSSGGHGLRAAFNMQARSPAPRSASASTSGAMSGSVVARGVVAPPSGGGGGAAAVAFGGSQRVAPPPSGKLAQHQPPAVARHNAGSQRAAALPPLAGAGPFQFILTGASTGSAAPLSAQAQPPTAMMQAARPSAVRQSGGSRTASTASAKR
jgi:hypothetical protein